MRASTIVRSLLRSCIDRIHATRLATLLSAVDALVRVGRASLTAIGRALQCSKTTAKHRIKRMDRLLGNVHLQADLPKFYAALVPRLITGMRRPILLIDWTQLRDVWWALTVAVPFAGRALPVYHQVHRSSGTAPPEVFRRYLRTLKRMLPPSCRPTIIADGGFCRPFWRDCRKLGFDLVVRIRSSGKLTARHSGRHASASEIAKQATSQARSLGLWAVYDSIVGSGVELRVVCAKRVLRPRRKLLGYRKRLAQPWVLATSRTDLTANEIVGLYAQRMKIEELFRDAKNSRFGWSLSDAGNRSAERFEALLFITSIALIAVTLLGAAAETARCARFFQANTTRRRRVLSAFSLGVSLLIDPVLQQLSDSPP